MKLTVAVICLTVWAVNTVSGRLCPDLDTCKLRCKFGYGYKNGCPICRCTSAPTCPKGMVQDEFLRSCDNVKPHECNPGAICWTRRSTNGRGICCEQPFKCPPNDAITTCQITDDNCFDDSHCLPGFKCCSHGCGKVCINRYGQIGQSTRVAM